MYDLKLTLDTAKILEYDCIGTPGTIKPHSCWAIFENVCANDILSRRAGVWFDH